MMVIQIRVSTRNEKMNVAVSHGFPWEPTEREFEFMEKELLPVLRSAIAKVAVPYVTQLKPENN